MVSSLNTYIQKAKLVGINARFTHSCLALFYLRNMLEKKIPELDNELLQFTINDNYYEMLLRLTEGEPKYVFFSASIWNSTLVERLVLDLQSCLPKSRAVIGGPQASVLRGRVDTNYCTIVSGEIEAVDDQFYRDLQAGNPGPVYGDSFFAMQTPIFDYPYRDSDFESHLRNRHIYYESSRGCPFHCSYCLSSSEKKVFHKDLATIKDELGHLLAHRPKVIRFIDRTFNANPPRALEIWKYIKEHGGDTLFHFEMAPDRFTNEMFDFLSTLESGKFQFEIGIQSTNPKTLQEIRRKVDCVKMRETIKRLAELGTIHLHVDLILGLPFETKESFGQSFRAVFELGAHYIQMGLLKILPDTPVSQQVSDFGYKYSSEPPYAVLENRWLDHTAMSELYWFSECVEKFVNNRYFVSFWRYLRSNTEDMYDFFMELLTICRKGHFFQLAPTQELLCEKLVELVKHRDDRETLLELLRYDWLRCNHRFLPGSLQVDEDLEQPQQTRSSLYQSLPAEMDGVYRKSNRNQFFRKSFFLRISQKTAHHIGIPVTSTIPCFCFTGERESGLFRHNKVLIF